MHCWAPRVGLPPPPPPPWAPAAHLKLAKAVTGGSSSNLYEYEVLSHAFGGGRPGMLRPVSDFQRGKSATRLGPVLPWRQFQSGCWLCKVIAAI